MSTDQLILRVEVLGRLGGRATKQASALLILIEGQVAYLVSQALLAMAPYLTEQAATERNHAFLEALALGRELPVPPTIQDLERRASQWRILFPENPNRRSMAAHLLGQKYCLPQRTTPRAKAVLGLNTAAMQNAYTRLYSVPLASIYAMLGLISIHASLGLHTLCREWLSRSQPGEGSDWRPELLLLAPLTIIFLANNSFTPLVARLRRLRHCSLPAACCPQTAREN